MVRRPGIRRTGGQKLDIEFHFIDLSDQYRRRVVDYMFAEYGRGRTPNPDVLCNREIKFDAFLKAALELGADYVATGHYCKTDTVVSPVDGKPYHRLIAGDDSNKDQSYFLCQLNQEQLAKTLFPIGDLEKPEVRRIAAEQGLATAERKDSQGICFVGKVDLPVSCNRNWPPDPAGRSSRFRRTGPATPIPRTIPARPIPTANRTARKSANTTGRISTPSASAKG